MIDKLDFLVRFWELKARHATLGAPLSAAEQVELLSLMQLVTHDVRLPRPGPVSRPSSALPAQLIGDGVIVSIEVRAVSAAALIAVAAGSIPAGSRVIVRMADAVSGVEYVLPCNVAWAHAGAPHTLALVVDGVPTRTDFSSSTEGPSEGVVKSSLGIGRHERLVG